MAAEPTSPPPGNAEARALLLILFVAACLLLGAYTLRLWPDAGVPVAHGLPPVLAVCLVLAVSLARKGPADVPPGAVAAAVLFIVGGAVFDVSATLAHTPDLRHEGNPVARALLDSGHPLSFVFLHGAVGQVCYVGLLCTLWVALLRHRRALAGSLGGPRSVPEFLKAATGGAGLTYRQWLFPLTAAELPWAYHLCWLLAVTMLAGSVDRWYLGLEWHGLVPRVRWVVVGAGITVGLVVYLAWLWSASRPHEVTPLDGPPEGPQ